MTPVSKTSPPDPDPQAELDAFCRKTIERLGTKSWTAISTAVVGERDRIFREQFFKNANQGRMKFTPLLPESFIDPKDITTEPSP